MAWSKRPGLVFLTLAMMLCCVFSCTEEKVGTKLSVAVKTNKGDPVVGAVVVLGKPGAKDIMDGKKLGESNELGVFSTELLLTPDSTVVFNVVKQSDTYYFAPHSQSVTIGKNKEQDVLVEAVLYFVPKPSPDDTTAEATETKEIPVEEVTVEESAVDSEDAVTEDIVVEEPEKTELDEPTILDTQVNEEDLTAENEAPTKIDLKLSGVDDSAVTLASEDYPKPGRKNEGEIVYTIHVNSGGKPVDAAKIFVGQEKKGDLKTACETNDRGRCVIRFPSDPDGAVAFLVRKTGYRTKSVQTSVVNKGSLRIDLDKGHAIDVFAITRNYNFTRGLKGVRVSINGKQVGVTDRYGHYAHFYNGKKDDLLTVTMKSSGFLPEEFETDFIASGEMTLSRYFSPTEPPAVKMTLLDIVAAGKVSEKQKALFEGTVDRDIRRSALKHLFSSTAFDEYPLISFKREAKRNGKTPTALLQSGWQETDMKAVVDALLKPTIVLGGKTPTLELTAIDSNGKVLVAAKEPLDGLEDAGSIDRTLQVLAKKLTRVFPFEGAVTAKKSTSVTVNIGYESGRAIAKGDRMDIYGVQADELGRNQTHTKIGALRVVKVGAKTSEASILNTAARAIINRGDLLVLRGRSVAEVSTAKINIQQSDGQGLERANVYFNDLWLGSTDEQGRVYSQTKGKGTLRVIRHGFVDFTKSVDLSKTITVKLNQETAFVLIESEPANAVVRLDGEVIGSTPLKTPIPVPTGFVKLEVEGPAGYKTFSQILELDEGTLDLTGVNAIALERDLRGDARKLLNAGKLETAIEKLKAIPTNHSDFLLSRHELGEVYLTQTNQPAEAAKAFGEVTADPRVAQYSDKRFIGTHINEGIALFLTAERLINEQPEVAVAHYQKAIEVLEGVTPQLRFVPRDQYPQAVHNVDFHRALSRHRLWTATKNPVYLSDALRAWEGYLDGSAQAVPLEEGSDSYVKNAKVYMKQAQASLSAVQKQALNQ